MCFTTFAPMRICIHLAYNGTRYNGWQVQPHSPSVQDAIQTVLSKLLGEPISIVGAGRTDTGVHASDYYAHFDTEQTISLRDTLYKMNRMLPNDIVIYSLTEVSTDFHARFSATQRTYTYTITQIKNPFSIETELYYPSPLDVEKMNDAALQLIGTKDFTSFSKLHTDVSNNMCTVTHAQWEQVGNRLIFTISANRFLRNMVRSIVGTLIDVGRGKISADDFMNVISSKNRQNAGQSIDACGLCLCKIEYPANCFEM